MTDHVCDKCKKTFDSKQNLIYHIDNNVCDEKEYSCKYCPNKFSSKSTMYRHMRISCKVKKKNDNEKELILDKLMKIEEDNKKKDEENKKRDEKLTKLEKDYKKLQEENEKFKIQMKKNKTTVIKRQATLSNNNSNNTINNTINNNTINNGTVINAAITLVAYGKEDMSKINQADILKVLQNGFKSTVRLTEVIHFNPNFPEYHNIYIPNMKDKYAMMYDGKKWTLMTKDELIEQIYDDKKYYIEDNLDEFINSLSLSHKKALERWLETDDEDTKIKSIKENIKLLLYNSKKLAIEHKNARVNASKSNKVIKDG